MQLLFSLNLNVNRNKSWSSHVPFEHTCYPMYSFNMEMSRKLLEHLKNSVSRLSCNQPDLQLKIHLSSERGNPRDHPYLSKRSEGQIMACDRLILVSATIYKGSPGVILYGFLFTEYHLEEELIVHIDKIDSTGLIHDSTVNLMLIEDQNLVSLPRKIIQDYLNFLQEHHILNGSKMKNLTIHVFARSQPEYLFVNSSKNGLKSTKLAHKHLIRWWKKSLDGCLLTKDGCQVEKFWFVPNESEQSMMGSSVRVSTDLINRTHQCAWKFPFSNVHSTASQHNDTTKVKDVVPMFKNDAKYALISSLSERNKKEIEEMTVNEFAAVFSVIPECNGENSSGLFMVTCKASSLSLLATEPEQVNPKEKVVRNI